MINQKVETEGRYSNYAKSQSMLGAEDSVSGQQENRGRLESKKKLKKVRSIRLLRLSSMRSSTKGGKSQYDNLSVLSSIDTESSVQPTPIEMADASPNYMKATSSSHAKDSFENTQRLVTKKTLTRMSTLKLKRSLTRKLSGRTEPKRKLKSSRSIKLVTTKGPKSTRKLSESIGSDTGNKSQRILTRRLSLKPVRILTKMPTFKSKNSSMEKGPQMSQSQHSSLHKATCSSTLKDSHFPDHIDLPQEESGSQGVSAMKVCPYSYCSLHGHRHGNLPPLKRFVSMRRRQLKSQKIMKMDGQPATRSKQFGNARKATQKTKNVHNVDGRSHFQKVKNLARDSPIRPHDTPASTVVTEGGTSCGEDEEKYNFRYNAEELLGETSFPHMINLEEYPGNSLAVNGNTFLAVKETDIECCSIATEKDKSDSEVIETAENDKNMAASVNVESTSTSANMEPDYEVLQKSSVQEEPKPANTKEVAYGMQERDNKYLKKWHLMYKHAVLSNTGKCENKLPLDEKDKEGREQNALTFDGVNSSSCHNYGESDQDMDDENKNVIELVQKAFDEILLPEAENLSSEDHLKSGGIGSDEVLLEKNEGKREERNTSTSTESPKEAQRMGTKPEQRAPKSWSNLKKLILLKRFVKALDKVRNINPRRPRQLPPDANFEAEKVFLKHQTAEERKNTEEWMLDYALQKVISKLAPAQREKVTLLIEAFETILPSQDAENGPQYPATVEPQPNPIQSLDDSSGHSKEETDNGMDYGYSGKILLGKASCSNNSTMEYADNASDSPMSELDNPIVLKERCLDCPETKTVKNMPASGAIEENLNGKQSLASNYDDGEKISIDNDNVHLRENEDSRSCSLSEPVDIIISSCHEEAPTNELVNEVPEDLISNLNAENPDIKSESPGTDFETKDVIGDNREQVSMSKSSILNGLVRSLRSNLVGSAASSNLLDEPTKDRKERTEKAKLETGALEEFPTNQQSEAPMRAVEEPETQQGKQSYTGLWYLVYKHMVSDIDENNSKSLVDEADEKESEHEGSRTRGTSVSYESPGTNQDMHFKDHVVADPEVELQQMEAIKMVEDAIDSILPDVQDHLPESHSLTDNTTSDNSKQSDRYERMCSEGSNQEEERTQKQQQGEESAAKEGNKPNQELSGSWSNLKKVLLLRRFIKALEKVRKFNPRGPRFLPTEPDPEAEKVNLRHQDMAERKGTEEWMLDYALRQVVSKLNPARKRKVELLVEAFETVIPTIKN